MAFFHDAKPEELGAPPLGSSVITMTVRNSAPRDWTRVMLRRLSPTSPQEAWRVDGKADVLFFNISPSTKGQAKGTPVSQTLTVVAPPGRWALAMVSDVMDTCHGAPFFDVAPGDVVYAGAIDFGVDGLPIDMNLAPAIAKLKDYSPLLAKIHVAKWTNGATFTCGPYGYALEYSDLPYAIGYRRAGK